MKVFFAALTLVVAVSYASPPKIEGRTTAPDLTKIKFVLFTRSNRNGVEIPFDFVDLPGFDSNKRTFILIHGWNSNIHFTDTFKDELLDNVDSNVFGVDWGALESWTNYFAAAQTSLAVGDHVGDFLSKLFFTGLSHSNMHVIGHSLGAQASGHVGRRVLSSTGSKVARISALDPAKPYFDIVDPSVRINKNDADFVDVLHTNSGNLFNGCLSFPEQLGHADFYPAGGSHQPGCTEICTIGCSEGDLIDLIKGGCSHGRANKYFAESINSPTPFRSRRCDTWENYQLGLCQEKTEVNMGFHLNSIPVEGKYFLDVNEDPPFAQGF